MIERLEENPIRVFDGVAYRREINIKDVASKLNELIDAVNALERSTVGFDAAQSELARKQAEGAKGASALH